MERGRLGPETCPEDAGEVVMTNASSEARHQSGTLWRIAPFTRDNAIARSRAVFSLRTGFLLRAQSS